MAFLATAVLCCCAAKSAMAAVQKASCSHCATKTKQAPTSHECCLTKASPMEVFKNLTLPMPLPSLLAMAMVSFLYIVPHPRLALRSIYSNGPPGSFSVVPLYIQSRSLRI